MTDNYDKRAVFYAKRKKRRRKIIIKRILTALITVVLTVALVMSGVWIYGYFNPAIYDSGFIPDPYGARISERVQKALVTEVPDWVDVQIINRHTTARTGFRLEDIKNIVVHYVGNPNTTAQNNRDYFNKMDTTVSSHFVVGLEGEVIQCIPLYERSAATNNRNKDTISIEVCHPDESGKYNDATYDSVINLISWLLNEFSLDESAVIRHYDVTGKICPKYYVENENEWLNLKEDVKVKLDEYKGETR